MKEVVIRDREEKLKIEKKEDGVYYFCPKCGQLLVQIDNDGNYHYMMSCPHYQWEEMSVSCFIGIGDECNPMQIRQLRHRSLIQVFDGLFVNLLIPRQS